MTQHFPGSAPRARIPAGPTNGAGHAGTAQGDGRAEIDRLYREAAPSLRRFFKNRLRDGDAADDMVQETFLRLSGSAAPRALRNPAAWLQRVARNLVFDRTRRARAHGAPVHLALDEAELPPVAPDQLLALEAEDMQRCYEAALAALTARTREIFLLHRIDELGYREIAGRLGISVATVEYHMMRALAHFDRMLGQR
ncbi:RNA polymerase sigma factor [Sphingomonas colocasiae]|uniref:RNA polymerase sigma factor n=1 Tax=Sphingomonas colocasiae TaxID=1848973 RepID=A0ABS7PPR9_9SPHN|nr:RNA polymerase sigma factor [Sphingomonas colocasiae]MBY8823315.1 RNA polymerase sigma factor [Sphingomonas colocasiae]MBY8826450.1 RNA polymerase sigma factor [Sphingomonas colocasiae]